MEHLQTIVLSRIIIKCKGFDLKQIKENVRIWYDKKNLALVVEVLFSILICWLVFHVPEEEFDVPRQYWRNLAVIAVLFYIAYLRGINFNDKKAWIYLIVSGALLYLYWQIKCIKPEFYGEVFYKVLRLKHICYVLFAGLMFDLIRHKPLHLKYSIKSPLLWLYVSMAVVAVFFAPEDFIPLFAPVLALILTDIDKEKWTELTDCFCIGYYIVYFKMFTQSLIVALDNWQSGRYMGAFKNISTTGVHVSIAVLVGLYFFIRWLWSGGHSKKKLVVLLILWTYPVVVSVMVNSRTAELGLIGAILVFFIFLHGKGRAVSNKRIKTGIIICIAAAVGIVLLGYVLYYMLVNKYIESLPYGLSHISALGESYEDGYFDSQILNKINAFSSQRLIDWVELIRQASWKGVNADLMHTHNVYIYYIIRYGYIGGALVILWALTYLAQGIIASYKENAAFIMPLLYGSFAMLSEIGMNGYWSLPLGFYWLLFSYPLIIYYRK